MQRLHVLQRQRYSGELDEIALLEELRQQCTVAGERRVRRLEQIVEKFLGASPMQSRRSYFDASPISYATVDKNEKTRTRFLLIHGTHDDIVDPQTQSQAFLTALKQAGFFARTVVVPGSGHFWASDPIEEPGSYGAQVAPQMLRFLRDGL